MKKFLLLLFIINLINIPAFSKTEKTSAEYLQNKKHIAIMNPLVEHFAQKEIKKLLKKELSEGSYKVKFDGYTLYSMKKGVFKDLEIVGKNLVIEEIPIKSLTLKTKTDYNWIDFNQSPAKIKSDITFDYLLNLDEKSLNEALDRKDYQKVLDKVNSRAYPLFEMKNIKLRIKNNRTYLIMKYTLPLASNKKVKTFIVSSSFKVENGKIIATNVHIDKSYGNLPLDKVTNLVNLLDPLTFALDILKDGHCKGKVENVKIENDNIQIGGKIFIKKGE
ncbi:hypothetical protein J6R97_05930 [bacterium]|nr:hypothetical protein [bacterium]